MSDVWWLDYGVRGDRRRESSGTTSKREALELLRKHSGSTTLAKVTIGDFRKVWTRACIAAGVPGRLVHDLRRTAARDFRRAAVSEGEIMRLCGWKTRDMFDRYNIIDASDLARAVAQRFNGNVTATKQEEVGQTN